ncbi:shikimate dehydrogenase [Methanocaldococcus indicus]|uniref:shikimate dehydrogenase n=1 Tax=Methanocaldococcus indicus TaxID=213231 RepID=UPI003C6D8BA4
MINASTKLIGLIGNPVKHSLSPIMHNAAFKDKNLNYVYLAFEVDKDRLKYVIDGAKALGIVGFNVTIPYKVDIIKYLDELNEEAKLINAVNTIKIVDDKAIGYNTDGIGARRALEEKIGKVENYNILIFGAGGAARAVAFELAKNNNVVIANRTVEKAKSLAEEISKKLNRRVEYSGLNVDDIIEDIDIVINATSVGMKKDDKPLLTSDKLKNKIVMDLVYSPLETVLLKEAKKANALAIDGLGMLIYQGAEAFKIWTGIEPNIDVTRKAILEVLKK